ncbi:MAG: prephenate dehydrogenase [Deltaproteobacteria bacterium]|nr:prephenate dehydrogenase [Deltaproteobacteria bacterium]
MFNKIAIIGVGLIGGSLGLEIKRKKLAREVVGCGRSRANLAVAKRRRLIDEATTDLAKAVKDADLVVLGAPPRTIIGHIGRIGPILERGAIVMDVGSTKDKIVRAAEKYLPRTVHFVGAHPLAGAEKGGAWAALPGLFRGKRFVITPAKRTSRKALAVAKRFWKKMGSETIILSPERHDRILSATSHLPQIVASALMKTIGNALSFSEMKKMGGGGLKDTTRIAASPAEMWTHICLENRENLLKSLRKFESELKRVVGLIEKKNAGPLKKYLERASELRRKL